MNVSKEFKFNTKEELIQRYVDLFSSLGLNENLWLTPREKAFFVQSVILYNDGVDLASKQAVSDLEKILNFEHKSRGVYIYRNRLKKKGWLKQTPTSLVIHPDFIFPNGKIPEMNFNIKFLKDVVRQVRVDDSRV